MNWFDIKEHCPRAYQFFLENVDVQDENGNVNLYDPETDADFDVRKLYDFFDEHELGCFILPGEIEYEKIPYIAHQYRGGSYLNRAEAETDLFSQAFQLLETKLTRPVSV